MSLELFMVNTNRGPIKFPDPRCFGCGEPLDYTDQVAFQHAVSQLFHESCRSKWAEANIRETDDKGYILYQKGMKW